MRKYWTNKYKHFIKYSNPANSSTNATLFNDLTTRAWRN